MQFDRPMTNGPLRRRLPTAGEQEDPSSPPRRRLSTRAVWTWRSVRILDGALVAVVRIDDAEPVPFGVSHDHEIVCGGILPRNLRSPEFHHPIHLGQLFLPAVDNEIRPSMAPLTV